MDGELIGRRGGGWNFNKKKKRHPWAVTNVSCSFLWGWYLSGFNHLFVTDCFVPFAWYLLSFYKTRRPKWWVCVCTLSPHISMPMPYSVSNLPPHHSWLSPLALSMVLHLPVNPISPGMTLALWIFSLSKESLLEYINAKTEWPQTHSISASTCYSRYKKLNRALLVPLKSFTFLKGQNRSHINSNSFCCP